MSIAKGRVEADLISKIEPIVTSMGYLLRDIEVLGSGSSTIVRISLDKNLTTQDVSASDLDIPGNPSADAIGIEDCSKVHQLLNPMFDVWDPLPHAYSLEVASPGEKPNLRTLEHFQKVVGERIQFQTVEPFIMPEPMKPRRNWEGTLQQVFPESEEILLKDGYGEHRVPLSKIKSAAWLREFKIKENNPNKHPFASPKKGGGAKNQKFKAPV